jgi:hypothetical protein
MSPRPKADATQNGLPAAELSSPACFAHEADAAYMGYLTSGEVNEALADILAGERADMTILSEVPADLLPHRAKDAALRVQREAISVLERQLETATGVATNQNASIFVEDGSQVRGTEGDALERLIALQCGRSNEIREILPKIGDERLRATLMSIALGHEDIAAELRKSA